MARADNENIGLELAEHFGFTEASIKKALSRTLHAHKHRRKNRILTRLKKHSQSPSLSTTNGTVKG